MLPLIHAVTTDLVLSQPDFLDRARGVMRALGERGAVHVRARLLPAARVYELTVALLPAQERTGCWLVVNDRLDIALAAPAQGAQLTSRSITVADARSVVGDMPLGASVHAVDDAVAAAASGADWVVAGHVFATPSKGMTPGRGVELVRGIVAAVRTPCIAIGGVRPEHLPALRAAGVHGVAVIRGIWSASDAERAATDYLSAYEPRHGQ